MDGIDIEQVSVLGEEDMMCWLMLRLSVLASEGIGRPLNAHLSMDYRSLLIGLVYLLL